MTEEERKHAEMLMQELEGWRPGMPPPEHPVEEHMLYARKYLDDIKKDQRKIGKLFVLWFLAWGVIIGISLHQLFWR